MRFAIVGCLPIPDGLPEILVHLLVPPPYKMFEEFCRLYQAMSPDSYPVLFESSEVAAHPARNAVREHQRINGALQAKR